jgi:hypothetical protein
MDLLESGVFCAIRADSGNGNRGTVFSVGQLVK